jgi:hypothetical protein
VSRLWVIVVRIRGRNVVIPSHDPNVIFSFTLLH